MKRFLKWAAAILALVVIGAIVFPMFAQSKRSGRSVPLSRIKQVALCVSIYATDYDDHFPPDMSSANGAYFYFQQYAKDPNILDAQNGASSCWLGNSGLAFKDAKTIDHPAQDLEFFDSAPRFDSELSNPRRYVVFVDCHAGSRKEPEFQQMVLNGFVEKEPGGNK